MSAQTEGAVLFSPDRPLGVVSLSLPDLKPGQVLVDVSFSGICGSQLLEVRGKRGPDPHLPHALGHEGSGRIVDVGTGVTKVKPGDTVVLSWIKGSGADVSSTIYTGPKGPVNSGAISTLVRRTIISENRVTPISNKGLSGLLQPRAAPSSPGLSVTGSGVPCSEPTKVFTGTSTSLTIG